MFLVPFIASNCSLSQLFIWRRECIKKAKNKKIHWIIITQFVGHTWEWTSLFTGHSIECEISMNHALELNIPVPQECPLRIVHSFCLDIFANQECPPNANIVQKYEDIVKTGLLLVQVFCMFVHVYKHDNLYPKLITVCLDCMAQLCMHPHLPPVL